MGTCKTKGIQADLDLFVYIQDYLDIFRHNQAHFAIIQTYLDKFKSLSKPGIFRTLAYPKFWYIQNLGILRIRDIFRTLVYSEFWYIQNCGTLRTRSIFKTMAHSESWHL